MVMLPMVVQKDLLAVRADLRRHLRRRRDRPQPARRLLWTDLPRHAFFIGAGADRKQPRTTTIFAVDPAKPFGLKTVKYNFTSDSAKAFESQKVDI
ncbi:hypothetical protein [Actinokineospora sp. HUAS TT18]|uniref:hypothetical protein n=1 Tax=Actinokineospora sp. HUAS TT18 TaxID=3447451 RepID=UPI003F51E8C2